MLTEALTSQRVECIIDLASNKRPSQLKCSQRRRPIPLRRLIIYIVDPRCVATQLTLGTRLHLSLSVAASRPRVADEGPQDRPTYQ